MKYNVITPCSQCPFVRGGIELHPGRARELSSMMLNSQGGTFPCHKTLDYDVPDDHEARETDYTAHCAGALIFAEKNKNATQMMRIAERFGLYNYKALMDPANQANIDRVFDTAHEMVKANKPTRKRTKTDGSTNKERPKGVAEKQTYRSNRGKAKHEQHGPVI